MFLATTLLLLTAIGPQAGSGSTSTSNVPAYDGGIPKFDYEGGLAQGRAYGFCLGQDAALRKLVQQHPDLAEVTAKARVRFDDAFGASAANIERWMRRAPREFEQLEKKLKEQLDIEIGKLDFSRSDALDMLALVERRALGQQVDAAILQPLLYCHPRYRLQPELELADGFTQAVSSDGANTQAIAFRFTLPASWSRKDELPLGSALHYASEAGRGDEFAMLGAQRVMSAEQAPTDAQIEQEIRRLIATGEMQLYLPPGIETVEQTSRALDGQPGYTRLLRTRFEEAGRKKYRLVREFGCFIRGVVVSLALGVEESHPVDAKVDEALIEKRLQQRIKHWKACAFAVAESFRFERKRR
jgi:hypothetical protein